MLMPLNEACAETRGFDVLVMPNSTVTSFQISAGLVGGLALHPVPHGKDYAVFEPVHGSAPKYAGMDKVIPGNHSLR